MMALRLLETTWLAISLKSYGDYFIFLRLMGREYLAPFHQELVAS